MQQLKCPGRDCNSHLGTWEPACGKLCVFPEVKCHVDPVELVLEDSYHADLAVLGEATTDLLYRW